MQRTYGIVPKDFWDFVSLDNLFFRKRDIIYFIIFIASSVGAGVLLYLMSSTFSEGCKRARLMWFIFVLSGLFYQ